VVPRIAPDNCGARGLTDRVRMASRGRPIRQKAVREIMPIRTALRAACDGPQPLLFLDLSESISREFNGNGKVFFV